MINDPNFSLELGQCWQKAPSSESDVYNFRDERRDVVATLGSVTLASESEGLERLARALVELRLHAEAEGGRAFGRSSTIYEPIVAPQPWGQAVAYYGHDDTGRQFSFSGIVTTASVITLYMSSSRLSEVELAEAMDEVLSRIAFH